MTYRASEIAAFVEGELVGEDVVIDAPNSIERAGEGEITFLQAGYSYDLDDSDASVVVCAKSTSPRDDTTLIRAADPRNAFWKIVDGFFAPERTEANIHPTAVIEDGAEIGENCLIEPFVYIHESVTLGDNCTIRSGAALGTSGWINERDDSGRFLSRPDTGEVIIGDDVVIRANTAVLRATFKETVIGRGSRVGESSVIGHGNRLGEDVGVLGQCWLSGSVTLEDRVKLEPAVCVAAMRTVGEEAVVGMNSTVLDDVAPGKTVVGSPARPIR